MTRTEAEQLAERLDREHPDRVTHRWFARGEGGDWAVVKVRLPEGMRRDPLKETIEAKPKPSPADDPRVFEPDPRWLAGGGG
jgi:hypothetical protein